MTRRRQFVVKGAEMVRYYAGCLDQHGYAITPAHIKASAAVYVADSRQQAFKEAGPYQLYFRHTLLGHGVGDRVRQQESGYLSPDTADFLRPEHREAFARSGDFRSHTLEDLERNDRIAWGAPEEVRDSLIALAEALGAGTLTLHFNQGAMPHEMFVQKVRRFAAEVLPALKAHEVTTVLVA